MGVIFFLGDFNVCGQSSDMSIRSSTSIKAAFLVFYIHPEEASFVSCFMSLPVVGLLGHGSPNDKPFGRFLESKDTCEGYFIVYGLL